MRYGKPAGLKMLRMASRAAIVMQQIDRYPPVVHPIGYEQPGTGRKGLNFSPWFALGVDGMAQDDGHALLHEVTRYFLDDRGAYHHHRSTASMVLSDYCRIRDCSTGVPPDH